MVVLALLVGVNGWLFTSSFVPLTDPLPPDYLLVARPFWDLAIWWLGAFVLIVGWQAFIAPRIFRLPRRADALASKYLATLSPLLLLVLPPVSLGLLATPLRDLAPPWLHLFIDLKWWLLAGVAVLVARAIDEVSEHIWLRRVAARMTQLRCARDSPVWDLTLGLTLLAVTVLSSPANRFTSGVLGDEPKYLRYLENWYRGSGTDISEVGAIDELPADFRPNLLGNLRRAGIGLALIARDMTADVRRLIGLPAPPRPGPALSDNGAFVVGKRGGTYQVHNPGLSLLLFPGYAIDRYLLNWRSDTHPQFPTNLYCTSTILLTLYLLWGLALFWLLRAHTGDAALSWLIACVAMLSLPATAFNYQYYPEVPGGLFLVLVARYAFSTDTSPWKAFCYGVLAGYLPWIHLRFGSAGLVGLGVLCMPQGPRSPKKLAWFSLGMVIPLTALCLYSYHITGSLLPSKAWTLMKDALPVFNRANFWRGLIGFWFDQSWGVVAHAPVYLLAVAGLWPMWRRSRMVAITVSLFAMVVVIPAAGHNWTGSGTTPLRLIAGVVPFAAVPLADAFAYFKRSRWFLVTFAVFAVVSVQNGIAFNHHFDRTFPVLIGPNASGWLSRLALPDLDTETRTHNPLLYVWAVFTLVIMSAPLWRTRLNPARRQASWTVVTITTVVLIASVGSAVSAWTGDFQRIRFMTAYDKARDESVRFYLAHRTATIWTAHQGRVRAQGRVGALERVFPNPAAEVSVRVEPGAAAPHEPVAVIVEAAAPDGASAWGTADIDFGDGTASQRLPLVGSVTTKRAYSKPGDYLVWVQVMLAGAGTATHREQVTVLSSDLRGLFPTNRIGGLQPDLLTRPLSLTIDRITLSGSRLDVRCRPASRGTLRASGRYWVWLIGYEHGALRAWLYYPGPPSEPSSDDGSFTVSISPTGHPDNLSTTGVIVAIGSASKNFTVSRSPVFAFSWPSPALTIGSPITVTAVESR
jgi:hypothetical protein